MSAFIPRPYQQSLIAQTRALWSNGILRVINVLPTGGGKTEVARELASPFLAEDRASVLCLAHTRTLVNQLERRLGCRVMTIQAARRQQQRGLNPFDGVKLVVWDEIHHADSLDWQKLADLAIEAGCLMLGLTATPWRFTHGTAQQIARDVNGVRIGGRKNNKHGKGLGDLFQAMIVGVTPKELVKAGYLVPLEVQNLVEAQDAAARITGDVGPSYDEKRGKYTGRITAGSDIRLDPVDAWFRHGEGRKAMVFCHLVPAAERACERFNARGIKATVVHGKLDEKVCEARLEAFSRGEYQVACNVMQLTEGYDCPDVACLIIDRGCNNLNTYIQVCGRGARPAPGKDDCLILDLTGCSAEHGHPQKDQDYWVVTSEGRAVSDLHCEVCGTRLSPMFPSRCMRCDPFRPKLGDPKELLDTGMRVYAALKDLRDADDWSELTEDQRDQRIIQELEPFECETEQELAVRNQECERAAERIEARAEAVRAAEQAEIARKAREEQERLNREAYEKLEAERAQRRLEWQQQQVKLEAERKARFDAEAAAFAEKQRARSAALEQPLSESEFRDLESRLVAALKHCMHMQRNLGVAIRDVRNRFPAYRNVVDSAGYDIPESMKPVLAAVQANWSSHCGKNDAPSRSPAQYELSRMLNDPRTSKYGAKWCQGKVRAIFGVTGAQADTPQLAQVHMSDNVGDDFPASW